MRFSGLLRSSFLSGLAATALLAFTVLPLARAVEAPRLVQKDGRYALMVEGRPYLILGGQIHNSSSWASELPHVWESVAALHANTVAAPVYWEQVERQEGHFDFTNVDMVVEGARAHNVHLLILWFGTWKNGAMHYVPSWVKEDPKRFPHTIRPDGEPIDVLSPMSRNTMAADKAAFVAMVRHLKQIDGEQHTILMVQVENEAGNIGSVRDNSAESNREFAGAVPADLLAAAHKQPGTWSQVFGPEADEIFQVYHQAKYINEIAAAGKSEFQIPYYINVWPTYPLVELPPRQRDEPGFGYPSGCAVQKMVGLWKALAPSLDLIGPDIYSEDEPFYVATLKTYLRADNPLWVPEAGGGISYARFFFHALGMGAIGYSPFGIDGARRTSPGDEGTNPFAADYALIGPLAREIAQFNFDGKLKTAVEEPGQSSQEMDFGEWQATVAYGFPRPDGRPAPGTKDAHGVAVVAQLGPDEFLVTGMDASVNFHLPGKAPWFHSLFITAEQGTYENGVWKPIRLLNGDETDRGLAFRQTPIAVRVKMGRF